MPTLTAALIALTVLPSPPQATTAGKVAPTAEEAKPIQAGARVPDVKVTNLDGKTVSLRAEVAKKPTILVFYRGGWCPFCNIHLGKLQTITADLDKLGYQILAISPNQPSELKKTVEKNKLSYQLMSDSSTAAMQGFGVAWKMPDDLVQMYKDNYKLDVETYDGTPAHVLPIPSVFVLSKKGVVKYVYSNADYKVRLEPDKVLEVAKANAK